jgi:hypothetical protein
VPSSQARAFDSEKRESERRRRLVLQALYESLPASRRGEIDRRAEAMAREELGPSASDLRVRLLKVDKKNDLLAALPEAIVDAGESQTGPRDPQIPHFASARDEPEPNQLQATRT